MVEIKPAIPEEDWAKYAKLRDALLEGERSGEPRYVDREEFVGRIREKYAK